jgi:hypothetical protein
VALYTFRRFKALRNSFKLTSKFDIKISNRLAMTHLEFQSTTVELLYAELTTINLSPVPNEAPNSQLCKKEVCKISL